MINSHLAPSELAILAGAGVSLDAPSNLLDGRTFLREVLHRVTPPGIDPEWVASVLDFPQDRLHRPGEILRFEVLMQSLVDTGLDPGLDILECLGRSDRPNRNHYLLAQLIQAGALVLTTNFDCLIEIAWKRLVGPEGPDLRVAAYDEDFRGGLPEAEDPPTLWKLHGSLTIGNRDTRDSVQATLTRIWSQNLATYKPQFLAETLRTRDVVVIGYSGWDDLDIVPVLANTRSSRFLVWVDHRTGVDEPEVLEADAVLAETSAGYESDVVGPLRVWFVRDSSRQSIRPPEKALQVRGETSVVLDRMFGGLPQRESYPIHSAGFPFGREAPERVREYFEAWERSLSAGEVARYDLIASLQRLRSFSPDAKARLEEVETLAATLRRESPRAQDRLTQWIEEHNALIAAGESEDVERRLAQLRLEVDSLKPELPETWQGTRLRLLACIDWTLEGQEIGAHGFEQAAQQDRDCDHLSGELATLTTWRGFAGFSPWGDHLPSWVSRRIKELRNETGLRPNVWQQELYRYQDVIDERANLLPVYQSVSQIHRFAVDIGDIRAEAISSLQLGRLYLLDQQPHLAMEDFLRVTELNRLLEDPRLQKEADFFLEHCRQQIGRDFERRMLPTIRQSMWGEGKEA